MRKLKNSLPLFCTMERTLPKVLLFLSLLFPILTKAEGTKEVSPDNSNMSALLCRPDINSGSYLGANEENRIYFYIKSPSERLYFGFKWHDYNGSTNLTNMYYRIYNPSGTQVLQSQAPTSGAGYISSLSAAQNGPNKFGVTNGYDPLEFTPATTGEYYIVFYRSSNSGTSSNGGNAMAPFFDFTVGLPGSGTSGTFYTGRVFSKKWGLVAFNSSYQVAASISASPTFYPYTTTDILKLTFNSGFKPIAFDVIVNDYGVDNTVSFINGRNSKHQGSTGPVLPNGYRLFLNTPESTQYPTVADPGSPSLASNPISGCGPYWVHYNMPAAGDARILLDLNGVAGYQPDSKDRVLEDFGVAAGNNKTIAWDGKDGLGNDVVSGTTVSIAATYLRGRINIPIYDAEVNAGGFVINTMLPVFKSSNLFYWNDKNLTTTSGTNSSNDNTTSGFVDNSYLGKAIRAWNGNGNPTFAVPAPAVSGNDGNTDQYDDYGNIRVLNTWTWALENQSQITNLVFGCATLSGQVFNQTNTNSTPNGSAFQGITVTLKDGDGNTIATTTTDENGNYSFPNIAPGPYAIEVTPPNTHDPYSDTHDTGDDGKVEIVMAGTNNSGNDFGLRDKSLPAYFGNVSAIWSSNGLQISWNTLTESNNSFFEVQVSKDGQNFTTIGKVDSKAPDGNSYSALQYDFTTGATSAAGLLGLSVFALAFGAFAFNRKNKLLYTLAIVFGLGLFLASCAKNDIDSVNAKSSLYVRIKQVDKAGTFQYSKVVKAIVK